MKSPGVLFLLLAIVVGAAFIFVSGSPLSRVGDRDDEKELPSPEKSTKTIVLSLEDVDIIKNIPEKTIIKLNTEKTLQYEGKTYYLIGENIGTSILTTAPKNEGGWEVLVPSGLFHPDYDEVYRPAQPCPLYKGNTNSTLETCANHKGVTLEGHLYALKQVVNQSRIENDPIHAYNIFDVYYDKPELSRAAGKEAEFPIYNRGAKKGKVILKPGQIGVDVELDESVDPPVLRITGYFLELRLPGEPTEKEFSLQGKNIPTLSEALDELTYLGKLNELSSTVFTGGDTSEIYVYYKDPYIYLSDLSQEEFNKQINKDQEEAEETDYGGSDEDGKKSLQLRPFTPARPTINFDIYILSDLSVLKPALGYLRPQITSLHVGVPECPALYVYAENGHKFSVKLPSNVYNTVPHTVRQWNAEIVPGGMMVDNSVYNYLFYTTRPNYSAKPPEEGWVISSEDFDKLKTKLFPSIGLSLGESSDASDYLQSVLPYAPYYLISPELKISSYPIEINPRPDTFLQYIFYAKPLDSMIKVSAPSIKIPERRGVTAVTWEEKILQ